MASAVPPKNGNGGSRLGRDSPITLGLGGMILAGVVWSITTLNSMEAQVSAKVEAVNDSLRDKVAELRNDVGPAIARIDASVEATAKDVQRIEARLAQFETRLREIEKSVNK